LRAAGIQKMALREAVGGTKRQKAGQSLDAGRRVDSGSRTRCQEAMLARAVNGMLEETRRKRRDGEEVEVGPGAAASFGLHLCCDWKWMAGWMDGGMEGWLAGWLAGYGGGWRMNGEAIDGTSPRSGDGWRVPGLLAAGATNWKWALARRASLYVPAVVQYSTAQHCTSFVALELGQKV